MAKIPFTLEAWLKDKSQKVETRDGRLVHNIWQVKEPPYTNNRKAEVCALIDGEEDALVIFEGGRYLPTTKDTDSPFDLFIITPEPELTEFEKAVKDLCWNVGMGEVVYQDDTVKEKASKLLKLAYQNLKAELEQDFFEAEQNGIKKGIEVGKAEALNDLPRWKKHEEASDKLASVWNDFVTPWLDWGGHRIAVRDLEKLPGFKED